MGSRAVIITGGRILATLVSEQLQSDDIIIGVDKGLEFLDAEGIEPQYIVGDFDSVSPIIYRKFKEKSHIPIREYNPVKDASDTEIAVRLALELRCKEILILGGTGTRLDHVWANVQVLQIPYAQGVNAAILDEYNKIELIPKFKILSRDDLYGEYFSVFSLGGNVEGLSICGAKYNLDNTTLCPHNSLSVSNVVEEEFVEIRYEKGLLILMQTKEL